MASVFPPRHFYNASVGPLLASLSAEAFRLWHLIRACTWEKDDSFLARSLDEADQQLAAFFGVNKRTARRWRTELESCKLLVITTFASGAVSLRCHEPSDIDAQQKQNSKVRQLVAYRTFLSNGIGHFCPTKEEEAFSIQASSSSSFIVNANDINDNDQLFDSGAGQKRPIATPNQWTSDDPASDKITHSFPQVIPTFPHIGAIVENLTKRGFFAHVAQRLAHRLAPAFTAHEVALIAEVTIGECKGQVALATYRLENTELTLLRKKRFSARARFLEALHEDDKSEVS